MLKIALGVAIGYIFAETIDEAVEAFKTGVRKGNEKANAAAEEVTS